MALLTNINGKFSVSDAGAVTFNNAFTFPTADGTANYVLKTNGSGQLSWAPDNDSGTVKGTGTATRVAFWSASDTISSTASFYWDNTNARLGVGETSPDQKLNVREDGGSDTFRGIEVHNNTIANSRAGICFKAYDWVQSAIWHGRGTAAAYNGALVLGTNPNTSDLTVAGVTGRMWILNNGNIGIGTDNPQSKLHVKSSESGASAPWTNADNLVIEDSGNAGLAFQTPNTGAATIAFQDPESVQAGFIQYLHADNLMRFATNGNNIRAVIDSSGNVGIGNANPQTNLTIGSAQGNSLEFTYDSTNGYRNIISNHWDSSTDTRMDFNIGRTGNVAPVPVMSVGYGGNVGIGTTSPQSKLHIETGSGGTYNPNVNHDDVTIEGSGNIGLQLFSPATSYQYIAFGDPDSVNAGYLRYYHGTNQMVFRTNGSDNMVINSSGNVGIGTSSPDEPLHLSQAAANTFFKIEAYADTQGADAGINVAREQVTGSDSNLSFWTNTGSALTQKMSITSGGNVAIGGTLGADSQFRVELKPAVTILAGLRIGYQSTSNNYFDGDNQYFRNGLGSINRMVIDSSGNSIFYGTIKSFSTGAAHLILNGDTNNSGDTGEVDAIIDLLGDGNPGIYGYRINTENWSGQTALNFQEYLNGSYTSRLFISKDGNVGIGTTSLKGRLDVSMDFLAQNWVPNGTSAKWGEVWVSAGTTGTYFDDTMLHLNTNRTGGVTGGVVGIAFSPGWSNHQNWGIYSFNTAGASYTSGDLAFVSQLNDGTIIERVRFQGATGNVGIGTDSPSAKLHVKSGSVNLLHVGGNCGKVGVNLSTADIAANLEATFTVKGNVSYNYVTYTQLANAYSNVFDFNGYPAGIYQLNLCTSTDASSYGVFTIKWSGTAGTVINTLVSGGTNGGYGLSFSGTALRSIANVQTTTAANLQCLVTLEAACTP